MFDPIRIGRYVVGRELAAGGMASVFLGRMSGPAGFGKTVALKRMHSQFAKDADFIEMFLDEARITSGLTHPNIVMTLDVLEQPGELLLVMEYIHGGSLASLMRVTRGKVPPAIASAVIGGALNGLHVAHEAKSDDGESLQIVHRDVSPQNILISADGVAKIGDFGIAKAVGQVHSTSEGTTKGKASYMAPEQALGEAVTPRADIFAAGIVLWEVLVGRRLVGGVSSAERLHNLLNLQVRAPSSLVPGISPALDAVVLRSLDRNPDARFATANEMAIALERALPPASAREVGEWVRTGLAADLTDRDEKLAELQRWCRANAPEMPSSVRDMAAISAGAPDLAVERTQILAYPSSSTAVIEQVASDTAIATQRDVPVAALPPRPPPARANTLLILYAVLFGLLAFGGVVLAIVALSPRSPRAAASATRSAEPVAIALPPPEPEPEVTAEPTPDVPDAAPVAVATPVVKPKPAGSFRPAGPCRIVPQKDGSGRVVFREVCQ